jgi:hypothetical protein
LTAELTFDARSARDSRLSERGRSGELARMNPRYPLRGLFIGRSFAGPQARFHIRDGEGHAMTFKTRIPLYLLCAATLGFAASVSAQTPTTDQAQKQEEMSQKKTDALAVQGSAPEDWSMVKGHEKGSIAKQDALPNSWLSANFAICDENHDDKVTEAEYTKCQKKQHK